ncbi:MAG TPA: aspartate/glutamate racemase family protein [Acidobacteriaceae bacterium]
MRCKTIGLIGGMSWESSSEYYRLLNETVRARFGGLHSAPCILMSVDFNEIATLQRAGDWTALEAKMVGCAQALEKAGAELLLICTNTMHRMAEEVQTAVGIPLVHIADVTAAKIAQAGLKKVGLLGTQYTMEQTFYRERLAEKFGLEVLIPEESDRQAVHQVIFSELCLGQTLDASRQFYRDVIQRLVERGAEGIILGCTEIMLLISSEDSPVPLFDTTAIHVQAALKTALGE